MFSESYRYLLFTLKGILSFMHFGIIGEVFILESSTYNIWLCITKKLKYKQLRYLVIIIFIWFIFNLVSCLVLCIKICIDCLLNTLFYEICYVCQMKISYLPVININGTIKLTNVELA